jgi:hypothetical protein
MVVDNIKVVVEQKSIWVSFSSISISKIYVVRQSRIPGINIFDAPLVLFRKPANRFVDYIPGMNVSLLLDSLHHSGNVIFKEFVKLFLRVPTVKKPFRVIIAPAKIVSSEFLISSLSICEAFKALRQIEMVFPLMGSFPLAVISDR